MSTSKYVPPHRRTGSSLSTIKKEEKNQEEKKEGSKDEMKGDATKCHFCMTEPTILHDIIINWEPWNKNQQVSYLNKQFAQCAADLLQFVYINSQSIPGLETSFRIELVPEKEMQNCWRLILRYHPEVWFYRQLMANDIEKVALKTARQWVTNVRRQAHVCPIISGTISTSTPSVLPIRLWCVRGRSCYGFTRKAEFPCPHEHENRDEIIVECKEQNVPKKNGASVPCGWFCPKDLVLSDITIPDFFLCARQESTRDVLFVPKTHCSNRAMVCDPSFWDSMILCIIRIHAHLDITDRSEIVKIAFNFGEWETETSQDKYALDCHAHAHILLSHTLISKCNEKRFKALVGRTLDPTNYPLKDVGLLESGGLLGLEMVELSDKVDKLNEKFDELNGKVDEILSKLTKFVPN